MNVNYQSLLLDYLAQLRTIVTKIPEELFHLSLAPDMFSLGMNAKIAANFTLRGYFRLLSQTQPEVMPESSDKASVLAMLKKCTDALQQADPHSVLNTDARYTDSAGEAQLSLNAVDFMHRYILPNILFHMSMAYAIGRLNGVSLSKGDFDGLHHYVEGFSFVD